MSTKRPAKNGRYIRRFPQAERNDDGLGPVLSRESTPERPPKRLKRGETEGPAPEGFRDFSTKYDAAGAAGAAEADGESPGGEEQLQRNRTTEVENVLAPTQADDSAIEEYELMRASQKSSNGNGPTGNARPQWIRGKSSIYVDAFNLALETVLEDEAHLFDAKEMAVFRQWKDLDYEAQYLYVRLFLRKTAAWHRTSRLEYYADVADPEAAVELLQRAWQLPPSSVSDARDALSSLNLEEFSLGDNFTFADASNDHITTVEEAASLLYLDELKAVAKEAKVQGRNKAELIKGLCRVSQQQAGLASLGLSRHNSRRSSASEGPDRPKPNGGRMGSSDTNRQQHFLDKIVAILGPCIRLSPLTLKIFERVHLVFYRSTEWSEKSLTTIILAKAARRNFPEYIVCRTSAIFASRIHLLEFETAIRLEAEVDGILESSGVPKEEELQRIVDVFDKVYPRWQAFVAEEQDKERRVYEMGEGAYLRRFNPAHSYTRIIHKAIFVFGRRKQYAKEHGLLSELLDQRLFHPARRGAWYQRKALLEEHYMAKMEEGSGPEGLEQLRKRWRRVAASTCEAGLQDPDCHLIHHYDLQKRLVKLERKLRIPRRLQHDFDHVRLAEPIDMTIEGVQLRRQLASRPGVQASTKTVWLDELDSGGECSVEAMCLSHLRSQGWKGYHAEGGVVRTLFAYLLYDILFLPIPNVFQTAYQTCPLDLHTDAFFAARASEVNHRLVEIANGQGERLLREVWEREHERRTSVVGLNWDFAVEDLAELVRCFEGSALAAVCKVLAQEYRQRGGGVPDLVLWRPGGESQGPAGPGAARGEVMFAEVKSANDRLGDTQRLWIHVLAGAGVKVALVNAVAREVREAEEATLRGQRSCPAGT